MLVKVPECIVGGFVYHRVKKIQVLQEQVAKGNDIFSEVSDLLFNAG